MRITAWLNTALDAGQFVPYATGMAEALDAELTLIRGECAEAELCDAGHADLLLVMATGCAHCTFPGHEHPPAAYCTPEEHPSAWYLPR